MTGLLALVAPDPEGGFSVVDTRDGEALAWRGELLSANDVATYLNSTYPSGSPAPAWDSLVHEIRMYRTGGEPECPLWKLEPRRLRVMVPDALGGLFDNDLWRPAPREET